MSLFSHIHTVTVAPTPGPVQSLPPVVSATRADSSPTDIDVGSIVGIVVGVTAAVFAIIVSICCVRRKSRLEDADAMGWDSLFRHSDEEAIHYEGQLTIVIGGELKEDSMSNLYRETASVNDALYFANPSLCKYKDEDHTASRVRDVGEGLRR